MRSLLDSVQRARPPRMAGCGIAGGASAATVSRPWSCQGLDPDGGCREPTVRSPRTREQGSCGLQSPAPNRQKPPVTTRPLAAKGSCLSACSSVDADAHHQAGVSHPGLRPALFLRPRPLLHRGTPRPQMGLPPCSSAGKLPHLWTVTSTGIGVPPDACIRRQAERPLRPWDP